MPKIILQDYTKTLRGKTVLDHIDLTLKAAVFTAWPGKTAAARPCCCGPLPG